jgi:2,4-dienoyl-CoA reductase-like NADH-dependent reductase (Old Yellow Enzyme family)
MKIETEANAMSEPVIHRPNDQTVRPIPRAGRAGTDHDREVPEIDLLSPPFARRIREEVDIRTGAVGLITEPRYADEIITGGDANLIFIAREMLREPYWALKAQQALGEESAWPIQHGYVLNRRAK